MCDFFVQTEESDTVSSVVSPHRALIFAQLKGTLDLIEKIVFKKLMPTVSYLRFDGSSHFCFSFLFCGKN